MSVVCASFFIFTLFANIKSVLLFEYYFPYYALSLIYLTMTTLTIINFVSVLKYSSMQSDEFIIFSMPQLSFSAAIVQYKSIQAAFQFRNHTHRLSSIYLPPLFAQLSLTMAVRLPQLQKYNFHLLCFDYS